MSRRNHRPSHEGLSIQFIVDKLDRGGYDSSSHDTIDYLLFRLAQFNGMIDQMEDQIRYLSQELYKNI